MLGNTFYHGITRKLIVAFGKLFSDIVIERVALDGKIEQTIPVPVSYGNKEKWLARLTEEPNIEKRVLITLPRIGFELLGMQYDPSRNLSKFSQIRDCTLDVLGKTNIATSSVPYNIDFEVYIVTKTQDDALRIMEQIVPYFAPSFALSINLVPEIGLVQDVPIILNSTTVSDSFDGAFESRREIVWTLNFTAKLEFIGGTSKSSTILHTKVTLDPGGSVLRELDSDVVGTLEDYVIVDNVFDVLRT